mgnify:FL=1|jgi:YD repeat-containing protein
MRQSFAYSYDNAGIRTGVVEGSGDRVTWSYDNSYRLTREQRDGSAAYDITYTLDPLGNRSTMFSGGTTTTYSYNAGDAMTVANAGGVLTTFSFDDAGNNTVVNAAGTLTTCKWDAESRLVAVELTGGNRVTFSYDPEGASAGPE